MQWKGLWWVRRIWERLSASFEGSSLGRLREGEERKRWEEKGRNPWEMEEVKLRLHARDNLNAIFDPTSVLKRTPSLVLVFAFWEEEINGLV